MLVKECSRIEKNALLTNELVVFSFDNVYDDKKKKNPVQFRIFSVLCDLFLDFVKTASTAILLAELIEFRICSLKIKKKKTIQA